MVQSAVSILFQTHTNSETIPTSKLIHRAVAPPSKKPCAAALDIVMPSLLNCWPTGAGFCTLHMIPPLPSLYR